MSDGKVKAGVQFDPNGTLALPFTERVYDYHGAGSVASPRVTGQEAVDGVEQTPLDEAAAKVIQYDLAAIAAAFEAEWIVTPGKTVVQTLPDVLVSVAVTYNVSVGNGTTSFPVSQQAFAISVRGSGSINPRATAEGTASILPSATWTMKRWYKSKLVNCVNYYFFLTQETTLAAVLTKLSAKASAAVNDFPDFRPVEHQLHCFGQQVSVQASAQSEASLAFTLEDVTTITSETASFQWGNGSSKSNGVSEKVETIPEAIHGSLTIATDTLAQGVSATVVANTVDLTINAAVHVAAIVNEPAATEGTATGSITFENGIASTGATAGVSAIPTSGLYLVELNSESDERFGFTKIHAVVVNFAQYA